MRQDELHDKKKETAPTELLTEVDGSDLPSDGLSVAESSILMDTGSFPWETADRMTSRDDRGNSEKESGRFTGYRSLNFPDVSDTASLCDRLGPEVLNPEARNPEVLNPEVRNPEVLNPEVRNPEVRNLVVPSQVKPGIDAQILKPQAGTILEGRYRLLRKIGSGGTADVYQAEHVTLGNAWAVKVLPHADNTLQDHLKEADILKRLNHPMLPRIADIIRTDTHTCIVMDYLAGVTLLERIEREGRIRESEVHAWMMQICDVLAYMHSQQPAAIIYRDLKPSNLIADDYGHLKLVDFGTARTYQTGCDGDTAYIGTQGYAAPEQYGVNQSDGRTDLYNLGMTVIHLLTGIHPVTIAHGDLKEKLLDAGVSTEFAAVIQNCVNLSPSQRYQDAVSCHAALLDSLEQSPALSKGGVPEPVDSDNVNQDENHSAVKTLKHGSNASIRNEKKASAGRIHMHNTGGAGRENALDSGPSLGFSSVLRKNRRSAPILSGQTRIAIMGVCPGAGTTFACIALSSLFTMRRFDTACMELNPSGDLSRLRDTLIHAGHLPDMGPGTQPDSFRFGGVDFHLGCKKTADIQTRRYDVTLADMGSRCGGHALDEFLRADWQFVYCPQADWKIGRIGDFFDSFDPSGRETRFHYLFPMEGEGDSRILRAIFGKRNAHAFPQIRNPFEPGKMEIRQLERVLRSVGLSD